jgi:hypothetical protein
MLARTNGARRAASPSMLLSDSPLFLRGYPNPPCSPHRRRGARDQAELRQRRRKHEGARRGVRRDSDQHMAHSASSVVAASVDIPNGWACYPGRGHMGQVRCCLGQPKLHSPSFEMGRESRFQQWPGGPSQAHPFLPSRFLVGGAETKRRTVRPSFHPF